MTQQKKKILILLLILSVFLIVILYLKFSVKNKENTSLESTPTPLIPTITLLPEPTILSPTITARSKVINLMPIIKEDYTIEYLPASDKFVVMILKKPFDKIEKGVENWFLSQSINPKDPNIYWWDGSR